MTGGVGFLLNEHPEYQRILDFLMIEAGPDPDKGGPNVKASISQAILYTPTNKKIIGLEDLADYQIKDAIHWLRSIKAIHYQGIDGYIHVFYNCLTYASLDSMQHFSKLYNERASQEHGEETLSIGDRV